MLRNLANVSTDALIELLIVIRTSETLTASDIAEINQIRTELRRRDASKTFQFANAG